MLPSKFILNEHPQSPQPMRPLSNHQISLSLTALASEIARRYGQMSDKSCASHSNCDPETTEDGDAMCAIAYAVEHMVQCASRRLKNWG